MKTGENIRHPHPYTVVLAGTDSEPVNRGALIDAIFDNSGMKPVLVYEKNSEALVYDTVRFAQMKLEIAL
jgi:hypothetical protein